MVTVIGAVSLSPGAMFAKVIAVVPGVALRLTVSTVRRFPGWWRSR